MLIWSRGGAYHLESSPAGYNISKSFVFGVPLYSGFDVRGKNAVLINTEDDLDKAKEGVENYAQQKNNAQGLSGA